jgi:hypothetical protein
MVELTHDVRRDDPGFYKLYRSNIRRHLLGTPIIATRLRELFSKCQWNGKKNGRGVPSLKSDFQKTLTFS